MLNTHVGYHVILFVHNIGDHAVLGVWLGDRTSKVVGQTPHLILIIVDPSNIHRLIIFDLIASVTAILVKPRIVERRAEWGARRGVKG